MKEEEYREESGEVKKLSKNEREQRFSDYTKNIIDVLKRAEKSFPNQGLDLFYYYRISIDTIMADRQNQYYSELSGLFDRASGEGIGKGELINWFRPMVGADHQ